MARDLYARTGVSEGRKGETGGNDENASVHEGKQNQQWARNAVRVKCFEGSSLWGAGSEDARVLEERVWIGTA
jgi:hypothetical protein